MVGEVSIIPGPLDAAHLSAIARTVYTDGPFLRRKFQHWRPYICPFERLIKHVFPGSHVLDIGCGGGLLLSLAAGLGMEFDGIGVDVSEASIAMASGVERQIATKYPNARLSFKRIDVKGDWPVGTFDVVFLVDVLHHIPIAAQEQFFTRVIGKVGQGGILVFKDMCSRPWWKMQANRMHDLLLSRELVTHVPIATVEQWGSNLGMQVVLREDVSRFWYGHELRVLKRLVEHGKGMASA